MVQFDGKLFFQVTGKGGTTNQALGTAFGLPSCMVALGANVLKLLPSPVLRDVRKKTKASKDGAQDASSQQSKKLRSQYGLMETRTESGPNRYVSDSSQTAAEEESAFSVGNVIGLATAAAALGSQLYATYQATDDEIRAISGCIGGYADSEAYALANASLIRAGLSPSAYDNLIDAGYGTGIEERISADEFAASAAAFLALIDAELARRLSNPELEPQFSLDASSFLSGTNFPPTIPEPTGPIVEEIFRLVYGPPVSKFGKFILSIDGLYFDSQTSGITIALEEINKRKQLLTNNLKWKLDQDPSLGGRGDQITMKDLTSYVNTILDPEVIDDSNSILQYYEKDDLLLELEGQKNRKIFDLSAQVFELQNNGGSQALIRNIKQVMVSENQYFLERINKRKKQIELAVKLPSIGGQGGLFEPGNVPINDFSYLEGLDVRVALEKQKRLVLNQAEVSGVVLPLQVTYVQTPEKPDNSSFEHLMLTNIGLGSIISDTSTSSVLSINNSIIKDNLICLYNILSFEVSDPSSVDYKLYNSSELGDEFDAQIVGRDEESIFKNGVGIAYLEGITKNSNSSPTVPSSLGSYIKLPPATALQDLLYNVEGATFETWVYAPNLSSENGYNYGAASGLYRLILANENTGISDLVAPQNDILKLDRDKSINTVKGLIFGFTRDRRITENLGPSNTSQSNPVSSSCIFLAPTQAFNNSSIGFLNKSYQVYDSCYAIDDTVYSMKVPLNTSVEGISFSSCGQEFCQIAVTFSPKDNLIKLYCDGQLMSASSYVDVFGIDPLKEDLMIPSLKRTRSFEYNTSSMSGVNVPDLKYGPKLQEFTPWIIGGGYTDGMQTGNFMGGQYGGITSGFKGFFGGIKFYSKPLTDSEVLHNFKVSQTFFKNVDTSSLIT